MGVACASVLIVNREIEQSVVHGVSAAAQCAAQAFKKVAYDVSSEAARKKTTGP